VGDEGGQGALGALALLTAASPDRLTAQDSSRIAEATAVLAPLIESYGVSGMESPVRETVKRLLPAWAKTETDTAGNLWLRVGQGEPLVVFVAHLDEIGFTVDSILDDGSLASAHPWRIFSSLFEAQPALVHTTRGDVPGIFLPREAARDSGPARRTPPPLRVSVGTTTRAATQGLASPWAAPSQCRKRFVRLAGTRATGRAMDDRVGSAAQILAVRHLTRPSSSTR